MRLGKFLSDLTKPELEELEGLLNLTEEQAAIFYLLSKGKSNMYICEKCSLSSTSLHIRIRVIKDKIKRLGWC